MSSLRTAFVTQLILAMRTPNYWMVQATSIPQTLIFLSVIHRYERQDLVVHALVAPIVVTVWNTAVWTGGGVARDDRWQDRLDLHVAAPATYMGVVLAKTAAVVASAMLAVPLVISTAWLSHGTTVSVAQPALLSVAAIASAAGMCFVGVLFAGLSVLSRAAVTLQSSASYPLLILGGVFVPVAMLPPLVQPISHALFLTWGTDLIRDAIRLPQTPDVLQRSAMLLVTTTGLAVASYAVLSRFLRRARLSAEVSLS